MARGLAAFLFALCAATMAAAQPARLPEVQVDAGGHYFRTADGAPFFWLGDTAWELIHSTTPAEQFYFLRTRARQGFTVIQTVVLAEMDGLTRPTPDGLLPFADGDVARPNAAYFDRVLEVVREAERNGLYVALLPAWGDKVTAPWGAGPRIFTMENLPAARAYGRYLGQLLRGQRNVIWMLGGDRPARVSANGDAWLSDAARNAGFPPDVDWTPIWTEMAAGIAEGVRRDPLIAYHPQAGATTTSVMLDAPWLDINGMQSGHGGGRDAPVWRWIARDYALTPARPTLDLEPNYEDHPYNPWPRWDPASGYFRDHDVRKQIYRSVFAGGAGVTYGHHAVWQFAGARNGAINFPDRDWIDALHRPGAEQARYLRDLILSRPFFGRVPDDSLIVGNAEGGPLRAAATRGGDGAYAFIYVPTSDQEIRVDLSKLSGASMRAWWYDPRSGIAREIDTTPRGGARTFRTPAYGPDWVLVLDDAARGYPPPGLTR